ncbi:NAD(P)/FAD-dependent oxidoreductase [Thiohalomonas denitrificans]|uniref:NAD(P)/FAD-dependent oxidoreductase n=1 Tax=Thiohalomonas denitrificans TaxID=415747 RepID=UPI0026F1B426|nr:NAD(P)/FAD-dependent oxidoreductase [Thiohalomonas denitrificans]
MESPDVLILGGGPAGSSCAAQLRAAGFDVAVMDRQRFPRDKVCAGWVTPAVLDELGIDADEYRRGGRTMEPIHGFYTGSIDGPGVVNDYGETVSYGIRRCEFDHYLLESSGARRIEGEPLRTLERIGDRWVVNDRISTPLVIGAGGHFCPVARHLGAKVGNVRGAVAAQEVEFELTVSQRDAAAVEPGIPELYFCRDLKGYGWAMIKGGVLNVGLGRDDRHRLSEHLDHFVAFLKRRGRIPPDIPERFHGHAYLLYGKHQPRSVVADGALLVGDAAGLAYPRSGEGIRPAVESALLATETVVAAGGHYDYADLVSYEYALEERFGRRSGAEGFQWLPAPLQAFLAERLLASRWFSRHLVLDRWFLHRHQPALASCRT